MKIGDIVKIKSVEWYDKNKDDNGIVWLYGNICFFARMQMYCGKEFKIYSIKRIQDIDIDIYELRDTVSEDGIVLSDSFVSDMFELVGKNYPKTIDSWFFLLDGIQRNIKEIENCNIDVVLPDGKVFAVIKPIDRDEVNRPCSKIKIEFRDKNIYLSYYEAVGIYNAFKKLYDDYVREDNSDIGKE